MGTQQNYRHRNQSTSSSQSVSSDCSWIFLNNRSESELILSENSKLAETDATEIVDNSSVGEEEDNESDDISVVDAIVEEDQPDTMQIARLIDTLDVSLSRSRQFGDDLPAEFVRICSGRIRNYMHQSNTRLNWKLTVLLTIFTATVCGLGIGHCLGTTHSWLRRRQLLNKQEILPNFLRQFPSEMDGSCRSVENPKFNSELHKCRDDLNDARSDSWRKAAVNRYIIHSSTHQRHPLVISMSTALQKWLYRQRQTERQLAIAENRLKQKSLELKRHSATLQKLLLSESSRLQRALEGKSERLFEAETNSIHLEGALSSCSRQLDENQQRYSMYDDLIERLRSPSNLTDSLSVFLSLARKLHLPESVRSIGERGEQVIAEQLEQIWQVFGRLHESARERLSRLEEIYLAGDLKPYYDGARDLTVHVGAALSHVWQETRDMAQTVVRDLNNEETGQKIVSIVADLSRSADRLRSEVEETLPAIIQDRWTAIFGKLKPIPNESDQLNQSEQSICKGFHQLADALEQAELDDIIGKKQSRRYLNALRQFQCVKHSHINRQFLNCQRYYWSEIGLEPKGCIWEPFQLYSTLNKPRLYRENPSVLVVLRNTLKWNIEMEQPIVTSCTDQQRPCVDDYRTEAPSVWQFERDRLRSQHRQKAKESDWIFERSTAREKRRREEEQAEWMFQRGKLRSQRRHARGGQFLADGKRKSDGRRKYGCNRDYWFGW